MANQWHLIRGNPETVIGTLSASGGGTVMTASWQPLVLTSGFYDLAGDGEAVAGVGINQADTDGDIVVVAVGEGVYEVVTTSDLSVGSRAYAAASQCVDAGSSGNVQCGTIVDYNPASGYLAHMLCNFTDTFPYTQSLTL